MKFFLAALSLIAFLAVGLIPQTVLAKDAKSCIKVSGTRNSQAFTNTC